MDKNQSLGEGLYSGMKIFAIVFIGLMDLLLSHAHALEDGFYAISDKPTRVPLTTLEGNQLYLSAKLPDQMKEVTLTSRANDNGKYELRIMRIDGFSVDPWHIALVLKDQCVQFYGEGSNERREFETDTPIFDKDFVSHAATFFHITPNDRHHPGHQFVASFNAKHEGYSLDEPIMVTFRLANCGDTPFSFMSTGFGGRDDFLGGSAFSFSANTEVTGDPVQILSHPLNMAAGNWFTPEFNLKPQESRSVDIDLRKYLKFEKKGRYTVTGSCAFEVMGLPKGQTWDDYGSARFMVEIK